MIIVMAGRRLMKAGKEQQMGQISGQYNQAEQIGNHQAVTVHTRRRGAAGLMLSLLKIGFAGFGGGCALIPVIEKEVVDDQKLVSKQEYNKDSLVACITPGALPVEISTGLGLKADGIRGMITAALAIALPGSFLTVLILALLSGADSALLAQIQCISIGLTAFISSLLLVYTKNAVREARSGGRRHVRSTLIVIAGVFLLTCGKTLSKLPFMNGRYLLGLSTIEVLGLAFFWIFYTKCERNKRRLAVAAILSALYIACAGNWQLISQQAVKPAVVLAMVVLSGIGLVRSIRGDLKESGARGVGPSHRRICSPGMRCDGKDACLSREGLCLVDHFIWRRRRVSVRRGRHVRRKRHHGFAVLSAAGSGRQCASGIDSLQDSDRRRLLCRV